MVKSAPKIKPHGSPSKNNIRRTSNPKTPQEQIQAIGDDLEAAIAEGATMVRVGSAIFGERKLSAKIES